MLHEYEIAWQIHGCLDNFGNPGCNKDIEPLLVLFCSVFSLVYTAYTSWKMHVRQGIQHITLYKERYLCRVQTSMATHVLQTLLVPWQGGCKCNYWSNSGSVHQVPIMAEWTEVVWNEKFTWHFYTWPEPRKHLYQNWELNPRPSDLEFNTLTTWVCSHFVW